MSTRTAAETSLETPKYSILKLVPPGGDARADLCSLIRLAKDTERYDDMGALSRALVILAKGALSKEERKLFITAHTQCLAAKRAAWRTMVSIYICYLIDVSLFIRFYKSFINVYFHIILLFYNVYI